MEVLLQSENIRDEFKKILTIQIYSGIIYKNFKGFDEDGREFKLLESRCVV